MKEFSIRRATVKDLHAILTLFEDCVRTSCIKDYNNAQIEVWVSSVNNITKWIQRLENQYFIVAENNKSIVGFSSLEEGDYLDLMYVHKDFFLKGIAKSLYTVIENESVQSGALRLTSDVSITALQFFEKMGFQIIKRNVNITDSIQIINFRMTKFF